MSELSGAYRLGVYTLAQEIQASDVTLGVYKPLGERARAPCHPRRIKP